MQIAVELDPGAIAEAYEEDWTKEDLISFIEENVNKVLGSRIVDPAEEQEEY